jgi:hypothetical protein
LHRKCETEGVRGRENYRYKTARDSVRMLEKMGSFECTRETESKDGVWVIAYV